MTTFKEQFTSALESTFLGLMLFLTIGVAFAVTNPQTTRERHGTVEIHVLVSEAA
jgi:hypothetical protein